MLNRLATAFSVAMALVLSACNATGCLDCDKRDLWGNVYPVECTVPDLADKVDITVILELPDEIFPDDVLALCVGCGLPGGIVGVTPAIWINERVRESEKPSVMRHEQCHRHQFLIGKPVNWHPDVREGGRNG